MTADVSAEKRTRFDGWLAGICASRVFNGLVFMSYAAALPVLQREWGMSAAQAGVIASGFQIGYAVSLVVFSGVADRISPKRLYLWSLFAAGVFGLSFAVFARGFTSALILHTVVGISLGGTYTTGVMIIADQYVTRHRGMAVGFFIASTSCGYAFSLAISGVAIPVGGYKLSFLLTCLGPGLGWFLAWITLLGFRSLVGFGAGAVAPVAFGAVLDWTNPMIDGQRVYAGWGWAFSVLGLGGAGAVWAALRFGRRRRQEMRGQPSPAGEKET